MSNIWDMVACCLFLKAFTCKRYLTVTTLLVSSLTVSTSSEVYQYKYHPQVQVWWASVSAVRYGGTQNRCCRHFCFAEGERENFFWLVCLRVFHGFCIKLQTRRHGFNTILRYSSPCPVPEQAQLKRCLIMPTCTQSYCHVHLSY